MNRTFDSKTIPTGLRRTDAAMHCGVSPSFFDELVAKRVLPAPRRLGNKVKVWVRQELDVALMSLPSEDEGLEYVQDLQSNPCDILLG